MGLSVRRIDSSGSKLKHGVGHTLPVESWEFCSAGFCHLEGLWFITFKYTAQSSEGEEIPINGVGRRIGSDHEVCDNIRITRCDYCKC